MSLRFSLVIPVYNEAENIGPVVAAATPVLRQLGGEHEILFVDDGSSDHTPSEIAARAKQQPQIRSLRQESNRGQAIALLDGLRAARGDVLLTMDGDGQNDPADFPLLVAPIEANLLDLACGWRVDRHDSHLRRLLSKIGNAVRRRALGDTLHDSGCQLRAMRREVVTSLFPIDLMQSFLPAIVAAAGFRVGEFPVRHHPRVRGKAHYGLRELWWKPFLALLEVRRRLRR